MPRAECHLTISNKLGMHARPAMMFVETAGRFASDVRVHRDDLEVDGKSIMQVMMLAAEEGAQLRIVADGPDAQATVEALQELIDRRFDEE